MSRVALLAALLFSAVPVAAQEADPAAPSAPDPRQVVGPPRGRALSGEALEAEAKRVAGLLRCPVCQGLSVSDSPTGMALNMRAQVREMVAAGYDEEQVLGYFEKSYGEFVRLKPPLRGVNWLVWLGPVLGLVAGGWLVARALRAPAAAEAVPPTHRAAGIDGPPSGELEAPPDDPALLPYLLRVREMAYGWPGGVPPVPPRDDGGSGGAGEPPQLDRGGGFTPTPRDEGS